MLASPTLAQSTGREAPFADRAGAYAVNYTRLNPQIATAGLLKDGAVVRLKDLGFAAMIDLRGPEEGTAVEKKAAQDAGVRYFNIPVAHGAPTEAQVAEFARILDDPNNAPVLVHCVSANRVGAMWALYRAKRGIPVALALEEGRAVGLQPGREADVRRRLGEPTVRYGCGPDGRSGC